MTRKNEKVDISLPGGKSFKAVTREDGSLMSTEEVAQVYDLRMRAGQPAKQTIGGVKLSWEYSEKTGELMMAALVPDNVDTTYDYLKDVDELSETKLDTTQETELARRQCRLTRRAARHQTR